MQSSILRAQLESALGERVSAPFIDLDHRVFELVATGIPALDAEIGGLPRGAITEIFGRPSSGKTSMLLSLLAAAIERDEVCALVDGNNAFSPESAVEAGVDLKRLLWVRCHDLDQVLKTTDLLLQGGGFGVVAIDVTDIPLKKIQQTPLSTWFRFQRAIEKTPTILSILSSAGCARTCSALSVETRQGHFEFKTQGPTHALLFQEQTVNIGVPRRRYRTVTPQDSQSPHVCVHFHTSFSRPGARP